VSQEGVAYKTNPDGLGSNPGGFKNFLNVIVLVLIKGGAYV
jgi:hypothetical protein